MFFPNVFLNIIITLSSAGFLLSRQGSFKFYSSVRLNSYNFSSVLCVMSSARRLAFSFILSSLKFHHFICNNCPITSLSNLYFIIFAGTPATTAYSGTSFVTTAPEHWFRTHCSIRYIAPFSYNRMLCENTIAHAGKIINLWCFVFFCSDYIVTHINLFQSNRDICFL